MQMKHFKVAVKQERAVGSGEVLGVKIELSQLWCCMHKAVPLDWDDAGKKERACSLSRGVCEVRRGRGTVTCPCVGDCPLLLPKHTGTRSRQCEETGLSWAQSDCLDLVIRS